MFLFFKNDGSLKKIIKNEYIMQWANCVNVLYVAIDGEVNSNWLGSVAFTKPNDSTPLQLALDPTTFQYDGIIYSGYQLVLTSDMLSKYGTASINVLLTKADGTRRITYTFTFTINQTSTPTEWATEINKAEYNSIWALLTDMSTTYIGTIANLNVLDDYKTNGTYAFTLENDTWLFTISNNNGTISQKIMTLSGIYEERDYSNNVWGAWFANKFSNDDDSMNFDTFAFEYSSASKNINIHTKSNSGNSREHAIDLSTIGLEWQENKNKANGYAGINQFGYVEPQYLPSDFNDIRTMLDNITYTRSGESGTTILPTTTSVNNYGKCILERVNTTTSGTYFYALWECKLINDIPTFVSDNSYLSKTQILVFNNQLLYANISEHKITTIDNVASLLTSYDYYTKEEVNYNIANQTNSNIESGTFISCDFRGQDNHFGNGVFYLDNTSYFNNSCPSYNYLSGSVITIASGSTWNINTSNFNFNATSQATYFGTSIYESGSVSTYHGGSLVNFYGEVNAITQVSTDSSTKVATTEFVHSLSSGLVKSLDTTSSTSLPTNASESIGGNGTIKLNEIAKTGETKSLIATHILTNDTSSYTWKENSDYHKFIVVEETIEQGDITIFGYNGYTGGTEYAYQTSADTSILYWQIEYVRLDQSSMYFKITNASGVVVSQGVKRYQSEDLSQVIIVSTAGQHSFTLLEI